MVYPLFQFAFISDLDSRLQRLADLAEKEDWNYRHTPSARPMPILFSYLHYTFSRLQEECKVVCLPDRACFNTGLVTPNQEEICAYFEPHQNPSPDGPAWYLKDFCRSSDRRLLRFSPLPQIAHYFDDPAELLYNTSIELRENVDHIIMDNKTRFPEPFRSMQDNHQLQIALKGAIDHAITRVKRNYKTAVPQFHEGRIQLLLPLCLTNAAKADLALVVSKEGNVYRAHTCLTLDMAYNNARLLARPDMEWLEP